MIVARSPLPEAAKPTLVTESGVESYQISPAPVLFILRGSEVSFSFEMESDLSHMLKAVRVAGRGSSCVKIRHDHPLNGLLANDDSGLIG